MPFKKIIVSTSSSGLANRLRAHSSVFRVGQKLGRAPAIHWPLTNQLNANFSDLFQSAWPIVGADRMEEWVLRTELTSKIYNHADSRSISFDDQEDVVVVKSWEFFDLAGTITPRQDREEDLCALRALKPLDSILAKIDSIKLRMKRPYVGLHIRTCDIVGVHYGERDVPERIHQRFSSGPASFITEVEEIVSRELDIYVSSDDPECEFAIEKAFPGRVFHQDKCDEWRKTARGMSEAVTDLYVLAGASMVIGSRSSQFSALAAELGNIPLLVSGSSHVRHKLIR